MSTHGDDSQRADMVTLSMHEHQQHLVIHGDAAQMEELQSQREWETARDKMKLFPLPPAHPDSRFLGGGPRGFVALYAAANGLIATRWRAQLADAWLAALAAATPPEVTRAMEVADATFDPAVSPLLPELPIEAVGRFHRLEGLPLIAARFAGQELVRRSTIATSEAKDLRYAGDQTLVHAAIADGTIAIGDYAFLRSQSLISIVIPNSITSIDKYAFGRCTALAAVNIPHSVTSIDSVAFDGCSSLAAVHIPDSVTSIGDYAFDRCSSLAPLLAAEISHMMAERAWD